MNGANGANGRGSNEPNEPNRPNENDQDDPEDQGSDQEDQQPNNNGFRRPNGRNHHANGSIGLEGFAQEWFRNRRIGLARLDNRPREREAYNMAMDRLFLNCERVIFLKIVGLQL